MNQGQRLVSPVSLSIVVDVLAHSPLLANNLQVTHLNQILLAFTPATTNI